MQNDKVVLVAILFVYLVLVSFVCASTFDPEGDKGYEQFGGSVFYEPIVGQNVSVSSATNLSDLDITITRGRWILKDGALQSDSSDANEFFIELYYGGGVTNYSLTNFNEDFAICFYRKVDKWLGRERIYRYRFDLNNDLCVFEVYERWLYALGGGTVLDSVSYLLTDNHPDIVVNITEIPGGTPEEGGYYSSVTVDGSVLMTDNYPEKFHLDGFCGGVGITQSGARVVIDREVVAVERIDAEVGFGMGALIAIMLKLILFHVPEMGVPLWLNLIAFKVPVLMSVLIVITVLRGV